MAIKGRWLGCLVILAVVPAGIARADDAGEQRLRELERKLEQSLQVIDKLNRRVEELERAARQRPPAAAAPPAAQDARIEALEKNVAQMAAPHAEHGMGGEGVAVHGFADVGYEYSSMPRADGRRAGFTLGNLDFFLTPNFGRVKMLAELNFEVDEGGGLATDLERLQIGYVFNDAFTLWAGRFHTPYGYWNTAFHHGAQIQAVTRPRFVDFEDKGGILPAHTVGLWANGRVKAGEGRWQYDAYVGNGSRITGGVLDFNAHRDDNTNKGVGGNVGYQFGGALDGLLVGGHALREEVDTYDDLGTAVARTRMAFGGGYFYYDNGAWEGIGEYYRFRNKDLAPAGSTYASWAAFLQLGRTFNEIWTPYYRWERAVLDPNDPYFASQESGSSYLRHVLGIRYALNANTALKFEANRTREAVMGEDRWYTEMRAQFAVRF